MKLLKSTGKGMIIGSTGLRFELIIWGFLVLKEKLLLIKGALSVCIYVYNNKKVLPLINFSIFNHRFTCIIAMIVLNKDISLGSCKQLYYIFDLLFYIHL